MNNESSTALQKASFVVLLFIAAALAYLIVRERIRSEQRATEAAVGASNAVVAAASPPPAPVMTPAEMRTSFAPLRPRMETNVIRVITNRPAAPLPPSERLLVVAKPGGPGVAPVTVAAGPRVDFAGIAGSASGATGGSFSVVGRVLLRGTPPPEKRVTMDATCGRLHPAPMMTRHYLVGESGALADVFVHVKEGAPKVPPPAERSPLLDQVNCEYQPYILGVQAGQTFNVRNSEPVLHNVHALPKNPGNKERNVGQPVKGMVTPFAFSTPEVFVQFKCDVHPWMFAYIGVVDHPWFAVTDAKGNFALPPGLPPGQYTLAAVHRKAGEVLQQITVTESGTEPVTFTLDVPP